METFDSRLSDDEVLIIEKVLDTSITDEIVCTDRRGDLVVMNAKPGFEDVHASIRGVVVDISKQKMVFNRAYIPVHVQDDLIGEERDIDLVADNIVTWRRDVDPLKYISSSYDEIYDKFMSEVTMLGSLYNEKKLEDLATNYINGFRNVENETEEDMMARKKRAGQNHESMLREISSIVKNKRTRDGMTHSDHQQISLICIIYNLLDSASYILQEPEDFFYYKCTALDTTQNEKASVVDMARDLVRREAEVMGKEGAVAAVEFVGYVNELLMCRNKEQISTTNDAYFTSSGCTEETSHCLTVFSERLFNENVIFLRRKTVKRTYHPVYEGYTITLFKYEGAKHVCSHRKFMDMNDNIVIATNSYLPDSEDGTPFPKFEELYMEDGDYIRFMYVSTELLAGSRINLDDNVCFKFEENLSSEKAKATFKNVPSLDKYRMPLDEARNYLKNGTNNAGEALYCISWDGVKEEKSKIFSKAYNQRYKIFSRNISIDNNFTKVILSNFMIAYFKKEGSTPGEQRAIFMREFPIVEPVASLLDTNNIRKTKNLVPLSEEYLPLLDIYHFRVAMVFTVMSFYCHERRRPHLIRSMAEFLDSTSLLIESINKGKQSLFDYSQRAKVVYDMSRGIMKDGTQRKQLQGTDRSSRGKDGKTKSSPMQTIDCTKYIREENPFSLYKMIEANRKSM